MHITLQNLTNFDKNYWLNISKSLTKNIQAILIGKELNSCKGYHMHIVIQFSIKPKLSRRQLVNHFGVESLNVKTKPRKEDLLTCLGYVSKVGDCAEYGKFTYRGKVIDGNLQDWQFNYLVRDNISALTYFYKSIEEAEHLEDFVENLSNSNSIIGKYLASKPLIKKACLQYEACYKRSRARKLLRGLVINNNRLKQRYKSYLKRYPRIFRRYLEKDDVAKLEHDYADHIDHDIRVIKLILRKLDESNEWKYDRPHKMRNLFLWSYKHSFGKTRLINKLRNCILTYRLPDDEYYTDYYNRFYQLMISDEAAKFIKTKGYSDLKLLLEGEPVELNRKLQVKVFKRDNPLIILADNRSFDSIMMSYHRKDDYVREVFESRLFDLEIKSRATLHFVVDECLT